MLTVTTTITRLTMMINVKKACTDMTMMTMMTVTLFFVILTCSIKPRCYGIEKGVLRRQQTSTRWHRDVLPFYLLPLPLYPFLQREIGAIKKGADDDAVTGRAFTEIPPPPFADHEKQ